ncbi:MAG: histidine phosphatase family protein, partial [Actinobacteria bacterium]|nr:histidine phosphatase family protein [Actinomycetota bacterium]
LIRHGRSADIVPGSAESSDPPLHTEGERQAAALGRRLSNARIDAVYSSHLKRAHDTALQVAMHHGLDVTVHDDLEEVRLGDWSHGVFRKMAASADPAFVEWSATGRWDGVPNGEGDQNFRDRVTARIEALAARHDGGCIAVVCHGGVINAYLAEILGTERSLWMMVENTSITTVKIAGTRSVLTLNDCHHLYDLVTELD